MSFYLNGIPIPDTQDIGDSLVTINNAFLQLDTSMALLCAGGREFATLTSYSLQTDGSIAYFLPNYVNGIPDNYIVYLDGVKQLPNRDYSINSTLSSIQFPEAPASGLTLEIIRAVAIATLLEDPTKLPLAGGVLTGNLSGTSASFTGTVKANSLQGNVQGNLQGSISLGPNDTITRDGFVILQNYTAQLTGLNMTYGGNLSLLGNTVNNKYGTTVTESLSFANGLYYLDSTGLITGRAGSFTQEVTASSYVGDGSKLTGIFAPPDSTKLPLSGGTLTGNLNGTTATFSTFVSAPALSGTFFGNGSNLTGISTIDTTKLPLSGGTLTGNLGGTVATFSTSVSAPALSGTFYGDGSKLTGIVTGGGTANALPLSGGTLTGGLIGTTATFTGSVSALALSGTHFGDGSKLTGIVATDITKLPLAGGTLQGPLFGTTASFSLSVISPFLSGSHYGDGSKLTGVLAVGGVATDTTKLPLSGGTLTGPLTGTTGSFTTSVSAPVVRGTFFGNGANITGVTATDPTKLPLAGGTLTGALNGTSATFSGTIAGTHTGNGAGLTGVTATDSTKLPLAGGNLTGALNGTSATFSVSLSAPALSGTHFGDGSRLTGITATDSTKLPLAGGNLTGALNGTSATFSVSLSAPALSGTHFGDGSKLTSPVYGNKSGTYVITSNDINSVISFNSSSICYLQIPSDATSIPIGSQFTIIQEGLGNVVIQIVSGSGVDLKSYGARYTTTGQYAMASLIKTAASTWRLAGTLS